MKLANVIAVVAKMVNECEAKEMPMKKIIAAYNSAIESAVSAGEIKACVFDFPTTGYSRYAQIKADLVRVLGQLKEIEIDAHVKAGLPVDEEGNDMREWCGADIEAAHAEAITINETIDIIEADRKEGDAVVRNVLLLTEIGIAHAEALEMNSRLDMEFADIDFLVPGSAPEKNRFKAIASKYITGCVMGFNKAHEEALEMNRLFDGVKSQEIKEIINDYRVAVTEFYFSVKLTQVDAAIEFIRMMDEALEIDGKLKNKVVEFKETPAQILTRIGMRLNDNMVAFPNPIEFYDMSKYTPVYYKIKKALLLSQASIQYFEKENRFVAHGMPDIIARPICANIHNLINGGGKNGNN